MLAKGGEVMWALLACSIAALAIAIERGLFYALLPKPGTRAARWRGQAPEDAIVAAIRSAVAAGVRDLERVVMRVGEAQLARLRAGIDTLIWLGNAAPLLGLLGTITGMIKAFQVIEAAGGKVDAQALAGGIWEAMLTTGAGLAIALPVLLVAHLFEKLAERRARRMFDAASCTIEALPHARMLPDRHAQSSGMPEERVHAA
ncbi:MAG: MotA/TolQ/ExbB proton channel family protein [Mariprofundaceae bacterium]